MTSFARILAALTGSLMFYFLWSVENWENSLWFIMIFASILIIYALIGHKLKGEGNIFTEDLTKATKRDLKIIFRKDDKS